MFALYTCFSFTREVLINYDYVISQKTTKHSAEGLILGEFHYKKEERLKDKQAFHLLGTVFYFMEVLKFINHLKCFGSAFDNVLGWDRPWFLVDCHANQTSIFVPQRKHSGGQTPAFLWDAPKK